MATTDTFGRRGFLAGAVGSLAGMAGWRPKARVLPIPMIEGEALKPMVSAVPAVGGDATIMIRNCFANRNPVLTRLRWVPAVEEDPTILPGRRDHLGREGRTTTAAAPAQKIEEFVFPLAANGHSATARPGVLPGGHQSPLCIADQMQLQNMVDVIEIALYYGSGEGQGATSETRGLRASLTTNRVQRSYRSEAPLSFFRDMLQACRDGGGSPDLFLISTGLMAKAPRLALKPVDAGTNSLGDPIRVFESDEFAGVSFVECPLMRTGDVAAMTSGEFYIRNLEGPHRDPGGPRGPEWRCRLGIEVVNEHHHCWGHAAIENDIRPMATFAIGASPIGVAMASPSEHDPYKD